MTSKVAIVDLTKGGYESIKEALQLIGGIDVLNTTERNITIKVGVFSHKAENHSSVDVVDGIVRNFSNAPMIHLVESDNYKGTGSERLTIWKQLFSARVIPFNLSEDKETRKIRAIDQDFNLSHLLFKPNVFVSTHILRTFEKGSILKNLFGCIPDTKRVKYHKDEILYPLLADVFEEIGGIDLAILDGTYLWHQAGTARQRMNILIAGRDAIAVETVGATLAGLKPEKMKLIQEFVKRGLGEGNIANIEIVGNSLDTLKERCTTAARSLKRNSQGAPKIWSTAIDSLLKQGFFRPPHKRTIRDVARKLEAKGIKAKGMNNVINTTLTRKSKKGILKRTKTADGWIFMEK
jgi:uncharacterized protein (DUF362 family)